MTAIVTAIILTVLDDDDNLMTDYMYRLFSKSTVDNQGGPRRVVRGMRFYIYLLHKNFNEI